ncbi:MAG TPA: FAD-binding oxidoreductase [Blastocatellia bacterium]|nr:FAD-binding oxidoreductase [Blastocatellia bacterium]
MSKAQTELAAALAAIVGSANLTANPALRLSGLAPAALVKPANAAEVADCLRVCSSMNAAVIPAGQGQWLECGNPLRRADVVLSLERMSRIVDYSAPDLTITVEAGITLKELNETISRDRLWLPLDPPGASAATVGAVVACNQSGALRCGFGTPRDYVIGLKLAHADGRASKSGGRVVKNVAGYDLNKLYVGSYGTLAVITEVTFKLRPQPEQCVTVVVTPSRSGRLTGLARQVIGMQLQPVACVVLFTPGAEKLLLRFADNAAAVKAQEDALRQATGKADRMADFSGADEVALWEKVNDMDRAGQVVLRMSVPLSKTVDLYEVLVDESRGLLRADFGSGIVREATDVTDGLIIKIEQRRAAVEQLGGTLFIEQAPLEVRRQVDAWGEVGTAARLMQAVKEKFDPRGTLNPGRFVAGI